MKTSRDNKVDLIQKLEELGASYVRPLEVHRNRGKAIGYMWSGDAALELDGILYDFKLWHHGGDVETAETLRPHFCLEGVQTKDGYRSVGWHCVITNEGIWMHDKGWFGNWEMDEHPLIKGRGNHHLDRAYYTPEEQAELVKLGFKLIVKY